MRNIARAALILILSAIFISSNTAFADAKSVQLKYAKATMRIGNSSKMPVKVLPAAEAKNLLWVSSNPNIATVTKNGKITATNTGKATITAWVPGTTTVSATCAITVLPAAITRVKLSQSNVTIPAPGSTYQMIATVSPSKASTSELKWKSSNKKVATVSANGLVHFIKSGFVKIAAVAPNGKKVTCLFTVKAAPPLPTRRALVIGESRASAKYGTDILPMIPSEVEDMVALFESKGIVAQSVCDVSSGETVRSAIVSTFSDAKATDVSYVYLTCHGGIFGSEYRLFIAKDTYVTAAQLRTVLDRIPGKVVLILNSCYSGTVIGKSTQTNQTADFIRQFIGSGATAKANEFANSKYEVLCASSSSELGYGVMTRDSTGNFVLSNTYSFFGKALLDGAYGPADANGNGAITLNELHGYVANGVNNLHIYWRDRIGLKPTDTQTVQCYPLSSDFDIF